MTDDDVRTLVALLATLANALPSVPDLATATGWEPGRVEDALAEAVVADLVVEWPDCPAGPAVMLADPASFGLRLAVGGEAHDLAYAWESLASEPRPVAWAKDRDPRRKTTRTLSESELAGPGWSAPLDRVPDRSAFDPAMLAEHREEVAARIAEGDTPGVAEVTPTTLPAPARSRNVGRPHTLAGPRWPDARDAWQFLAAGSPWESSGAPDHRTIPGALPANLRGGAPNRCPHCRGAAFGGIELCLYCDSCSIDGLVGLPRAALDRQAARESARRDAEAEEEAARALAAKGRRRSRRNE